MYVAEGGLCLRVREFTLHCCAPRHLFRCSRVSWRYDFSPLESKGARFHCSNGSKTKAVLTPFKWQLSFLLDLNELSGTTFLLNIRVSECSYLCLKCRFWFIQYNRHYNEVHIFNEVWKIVTNCHFTDISLLQISIKFSMFLK